MECGPQNTGMPEAPSEGVNVTFPMEGEAAGCHGELSAQGDVGKQAASPEPHVCSPAL